MKSARFALLLLSLFLVSLTPAPLRASDDEPQGRGRKWALCVGVGRYADRLIPQLPTGAKDAAAIARVLEEHGGFDEVLMFTDAFGRNDPRFPSRANILGALNRASETIRPNDLVLFSFSGSGCVGEGGGSFLLTPDSRPGNLEETAIPLEAVLELVHKTGARRSVLFLDAAREGIPGKGVSTWAVYPDRYFRRGAASAVFYAAGKGFISLIDVQSGHSAFASHLVRGLEGEADRKYGGNKDGLVTLKELVSYVELALEDWCTATSHRQLPWIRILEKGHSDMVLSTVEKTRAARAIERSTPAAPVQPPRQKGKVVLVERTARTPVQEPVSRLEILPLVEAPPRPAAQSQDGPVDEGKPAEGVAPGPGEETRAVVQLRSRPRNVTPEEMKSILHGFGFYSTCLSYNGEFCNPSGEFENQFRDNGDGTVSDLATGLMWEKGGSREGLSWAAARAYAEKANRDGLAGFRDWRVPTVEELASIMESSWKNEDLFIGPLFDRTQRQCWSADSRGTESAWKANFSRGLITDFPTSFPHHVRLVRSLPVQAPR